MKTQKVHWTCPKCKKKNSYSVKIEMFGIPVVIGKPGCKNCGLKRFESEYYELVKGGIKNAKNIN